MAKKIFNLNEEEIMILHQIMQENGFNTEVQAIKFLLSNYRAVYEQVVNIDNRLKILLSMMKEIEFKENMLMDGLNTILIDEKIRVCKPVGMLESEVFKASKDYQKERLANMKQRKDYKK